MATLENAVIKNKQDIATNATNIETKIPHPKNWKYVSNDLEKSVPNMHIALTYGYSSDCKIIYIDGSYKCWFIRVADNKMLYSDWGNIFIPDFLLK